MKRFHSVTRLWLTASLLGTLGLTSPAQATERVQCVQDSATRFHCRIDEPNVNQPATTYPAIRFLANDSVQITAGGCVQTGGSGSTWKRYVNPSGTNSDRLYHGLIQLPGVTSGLRRILDMGPGPFVIPTGIDTTNAYLKLGYEDDNYSDNGYYSHDDGTQNQCLNVGAAYLQITVDRPLPPPQCVGTPPADLQSVCCVPSGAPAPADVDLDGIPDACEQALATRYAPIVYHSSDESNFPTNVDWFLPKTSLWFYDDACEPDWKVQAQAAPTQSSLLSWYVTGGCGSTDSVYSNGTRSQNKQRTFFLADVADAYRPGSPDTNDWRTYVHAYRNTLGGVTLQYWRFYAYNDAVNNHGGDWEGLHVILDGQLNASRIALLGHTSIDEKLWSAFTVEGTHPRVFSEGGGHATHETGSGIAARGCSYFPCVIDPNNPATYVRQETWAGGLVAWPDGRRTTSGGLLNVGEKLHPMNGQVFIQYSGIWGSPGLLYGTSGYWGPAYNETGMDASTHYLAAWCWGLVGSNVNGECFPAAVSR